MEFSKKLLILSWSVTLILTVVSFGFSVMQLPLDALFVIAPLSWAETGTATAFYFWKSKNENRAKYAQKFLQDFSKDHGADIAIRMAEIVLKD